MSFSANLIIITLISAVLVFYLYYILRKSEEEDTKQQSCYELEDLIDCVKESFNDILNANLSEFNLKKEVSIKREQLRASLKKALRTCSYGNVGEKEYVKDYIKSLLVNQYHISQENINDIIPDFLRRRSCECTDHRAFWQEVHKLTDLKIAWSEILPPL